MLQDFISSCIRSLFPCALGLNLLLWLVSHIKSLSLQAAAHASTYIACVSSKLSFGWTHLSRGNMPLCCFRIHLCRQPLCAKPYPWPACCACSMRGSMHPPKCCKLSSNLMPQTFSHLVPSVEASLMGARDPPMRPLSVSWFVSKGLT